MIYVGSPVFVIELFEFSCLCTSQENIGSGRVFCHDSSACLLWNRIPILNRIPNIMWFAPLVTTTSSNDYLWWFDHGWWWGFYYHYWWYIPISKYHQYPGFLIKICVIYHKRSCQVLFLFSSYIYPYYHKWWSFITLVSQADIIHVQKNACYLAFNSAVLNFCILNIKQIFT